MLIEDLISAGIVIQKIEYEEDADAGMKYFEGELSAEAFLNKYDFLRNAGMGGMDYTIYCQWQKQTFTAGMADNEYGKSYNRIVFGGISSEKTMKEILKALEKIFLES